MKRSSGILMPIFSLPSPYGIGTLGKAARMTLRTFWQAAGQPYWQMLPLGPTSYGDSPYQSFSTFAGNPYFIDPDLLRGGRPADASRRLTGLLLGRVTPARWTTALCTTAG